MDWIAHPCWTSGSLQPSPPVWMDALGRSFFVLDEDQGTHVLETVPKAASFASQEALFVLLLTEAWWSGSISPDRAVALVGEVSLLDEVALRAEEIWWMLSMDEQFQAARRGGEVLRGQGADAIWLADAGLAIYLSSQPGVRLRSSSADAASPSGFMLSEVEPPLEKVDPSPRPKRRGPPKAPRCIRSFQGPQDALLDACGLLVGFVGLRHPARYESLLELRRELLLDGLDRGVLRWENLLLPFRSIGVELAPDELEESVVDHAADLRIHPEIALELTGPARAQWKKASHDGLVFVRDPWSLVLPHYHLRGFDGAPLLWKRICCGEGVPKTGTRDSEASR